MQMRTAEEIGVFLRKDANGNKIDHFDFDKRNTAFERGLGNGLNVRINGGSVRFRSGSR